jgi:Ca-activated chloride channel family protein
VTGGVVLSKNLTLLIIRLLIIFFLCFSAAGLTVWYEAPGSDFNYVIAIDASSSMLADDFDPDRLTVAKERSKAFVDSLDAKVNLGIVSFSGVSKIESTLTSERADISKVLDELVISGVGGTDISNAIFNSVNVLLAEPDRSMSIIMITDGQHTVGSPIEEGISYAITNRVVIHTVGIGTEAGGKFEISSLLSTLDEDSLTHIARSTGGKFFKAESAGAMTAAFNEIVELSEQNIPVQLRLSLLIIGLLLLISEWVLANSRFRTLP